MKKNIAIKVQNISKIYKLYSKPIDRLKESLNPFGRKYHKDFYALKNISFEIKKGETVGIIGRNGSGKSTILKIITGVLQPSSGKVIVNGKISAILELSSGLNPELNGIENIYLNATINGLSKEEIDQKLEQIVEFSELGDFIYQPLKMYSSGMKARLAFSIAINVDPDILIVDEALAVGDAAFQRKCFARMEEIRKKGATILFVSHSAESIVSLCNRAIWLHKGDMILDGEPKLVTGLYMKYSNENVIDKSKILEEFENIKNKKYELNNLDNVEKVSDDKSIEEYFDPTLIPTSTISYDEKGARISNVVLTTLDGKKVNVVKKNKEYILQYEVEIMQKLDNVNCGFSLKTEKGIAISGGTININKFLGQKVVDNKRLLLKWQIKLNLNPGFYFFNTGISNNKKHIHRILDAYVIKILPEKNDYLKATGLCDMIKKVEIC